MNPASDSRSGHYVVDDSLLESADLGVPSTGWPLGQHCWWCGRGGSDPEPPTSRMWTSSVWTPTLDPAVRPCWKPSRQQTGHSREVYAGTSGSLSRSRLTVRIDSGNRRLPESGPCATGKKRWARQDGLGDRGIGTAEESGQWWHEGVTGKPETRDAQLAIRPLGLCRASSCRCATHPWGRLVWWPLHERDRQSLQGRLRHGLMEILRRASGVTQSRHGHGWCLDVRTTRTLHILPRATDAASFAALGIGLHYGPQVWRKLRTWKSA